jgi:hypothetical protein
MMKRVILSDLESEYLIAILEELAQKSNFEKLDQKWIDKINKTKKHFDLEMSFYKIKNDPYPPNKQQMLRWLVTKIKNKTGDL